MLVSSDGVRYKQLENLKDECSKLQIENQKLKTKYEQQIFELKKYKDENIRKNKELDKECLTDTAYWMKRSFENATAYNELKNEQIDFEELKYKLLNTEKCKIKIVDKKIKKQAQETFNDFI